MDGAEIAMQVTGAAADDLVRKAREMLNGTSVAGPQLTRAEKPAANSDNPAKSGAKRYAAVFLLITILGLVGIWHGNRAFAPEMYGIGGMVPAADAHAQGLNYAVFDLNLNIRALREEQLSRMTTTPDVIILGASHYQEGSKAILPGRNVFNAHIHRDYWEDLLGMPELLIRHNRLPKTLIISIRDKQFTPVAKRKDYLWEPGIPAYRAMAARLGLETESWWKTLPYDRMRALVSLPMLFENVTRWLNADERPGPSSDHQFATLDTLLPDGSIVWSKKHKALFTQERAHKEVMSFLEKSLNDPPQVDPNGVAAFDRMLTYLKQQGVTVYLMNPPFNPDFYDRIANTPYAEGLHNIETLVQKLAADHNLSVVGSFNPHKIGCEASMYIDAEHSNETCLKKLFDQFSVVDAAKGGA